MNQTLKLGVARKIITPHVGGNLYGYRPDVYSTSVHDDLTLTAFYFVDGAVQALMLNATLASIRTSTTEQILSLIEERFGIPKEHCILHSTHTHSAPNLTGTVGWGDFDTDYYDNIFLPALLSAVEEAMRAPVAVRLGVAVQNSYIGVNRRELTLENRIILGQNPWGPFNPEMTVLSFCDLEGKNIANIVHYGMHGTCAGINHEISRDWSGVMIDALEDASDGITAFFNGPEGDVGPRLTNGATTGVDDVRYVERHGGLAAQDAMRVFRSIRSYQNVSLSARTDTLEIPLEPRIDLERAKAEYEKHAGDTVNLGGAKANYYKKQIELYEQGYVDKPFMPVSQTIIKLGDVAFVSFPYEPFSEIGMRIAQGSKIPYTLSLSNTNGSEGYFVTEDQICRGGYEIDMFKTGQLQPYADNADWHLILQTLKNLEKLIDIN